MRARKAGAWAPSSTKCRFLRAFKASLIAPTATSSYDLTQTTTTTTKNHQNSTEVTQISSAYFKNFKINIFTTYIFDQLPNHTLYLQIQIQFFFLFFASLWIWEEDVLLGKKERIVRVTYRQQLALIFLLTNHATSSRLYHPQSGRMLRFYPSLPNLGEIGKF